MRPTDLIIDHVAVERALSGHPVTLTVPEREEAVRRLHAQGCSTAQVADRLRIARRTVLRIRGRLGLTTREKANA